MALIATLTLNPALDLTTDTDEVRPTDKLRCSEPSFEPGGGGINVARVVAALGGETVAVFPSGGPAGKMLEDLLARRQVPVEPVPISGATRESLTVGERSTGGQYRFVMPGPRLSDEEQQGCLERLSAQSPGPAYVVASGSAPPGLAGDFYARLGRLCRRIGARFVLDTSGDALKAAAGQGVYLVKPNLAELAAATGRKPRDDAAELAAAREFRDAIGAQAVVVSLGARGALLVTGEEQERIAAIEVPVCSAVGAGDSMTGAMVFGLAQGLPLGEAVRLGNAAGAAAMLTPGTELARAEDVRRLYGPLPTE